MSTPSDLSTLSRIETKVRRLTASPSANQLSQQDIYDKVNTFYLFDVPENLRLWNLRSEYNFYTEPFVEAYNFPRNTFVNIYKPIYIAGYESFYSQDRLQFYRIYPHLQFEQDVATADGIETQFTFTVSNTPVLQGYQYLPDTTIFSQFFVSFIDSNNQAIVSRDDGSGGFITEDGENAVLGSIDYETGTITNVSFGSPTITPQAGAVITAQYVSYVASRPEAMLFYNNTLFLRPIPDNAYKVSMEVLKQPTILLQESENPALEEWWQYLAYGAAKKILEERMDMVSLSNIIPEFRNQEILILRRTTQQLAQERAATIFTEQTQLYGNFFYRF